VGRTNLASSLIEPFTSEEHVPLSINDSSAGERKEVGPWGVEEEKDSFVLGMVYFNGILAGSV